jgi:hypothetical protein
MKYMLMMNRQAVDSTPPAQEMTPEEMSAGRAHMKQIYQDLVEAGELLGTEQLAGPAAAKIVTSDGVAAPVATDGPFPETMEFLAGFWMIDVEIEQRAIEIAARTSAAPGPGGRPARYAIEVRPIMSGPDPQL